MMDITPLESLARTANMIDEIKVMVEEASKQPLRAVCFMYGVGGEDGYYHVRVSGDALLLMHMMTEQIQKMMEG